MEYHPMNPPPYCVKPYNSFVDVALVGKLLLPFGQGLEENASFVGITKPLLLR